MTKSIKSHHILLVFFTGCFNGCISTSSGPADHGDASNVLDSGSENITALDTEDQPEWVIAQELSRNLQLWFSWLGGIGRATEVYVVEHNHQLPGSEYLDAEQLNNQVSAKAFDKLIPYLGNVNYIVAPKNAHNVPPVTEFLEWSEERRIDWIVENSAFVFVPRSTYSITNPDKVILVFTRNALPDGTTLGILWADGHITREPMKMARQIIKDQTGKPLEEWSQ